MQKLLPIFFKERVLKGFFCFSFVSLFFPIQTSASCYDLLRLRNFLGVQGQKPKPYNFDANQIEALGYSERFHAQEKIEELRDFNQETRTVVGLEPKVYGQKRSQTQVDAWFNNIAGRFNQIRERHADAEVTRAQSTDPRLSLPPTSLMSVEEFLGLLDGAFASQKYPLAKILKDFNIERIRFVDKKSFSSSHKSWFTRIFSKNEVILEVPDINFENRLEAALWVENFILNLHEGAIKYVSHKLDDSSNMIGLLKRFGSRDKKSAEQLWYEDSGDGVSFKKKTEKLDRAVGDMLQEVTDYIENLTSAYGQNELVKLQEKNFERVMEHPLTYWALEASSFTSLAPITALASTHPLYWYKPNRYWLQGKKAIRLERVILENRMKSYFSRRKRTALTNNIGIALAANSILNVFKNGAPVDLDDKEDDIRDKTKQLNSSDETLSDSLRSLQKDYAQLKKDLSEAEKAQDDTKVLETHKKINQILQRLEALDVDK